MINAWWIPKEKQYLPETKRWYCRNCDARTPIEKNPQWNGDFTGERPAPEWFVRCSKCGNEHHQQSFCCCPNCGWDNLPERGGDEKPKELIEIGNPVSGSTLDGNYLDWDETWKCPKCKTIFTFTNGAY